MRYVAETEKEMFVRILKEQQGNLLLKLMARGLNMREGERLQEIEDQLHGIKPIRDPYELERKP